VTGKGNRQRIVLFGRNAKEALLAYLGDRNEGFLFQTDRRTQDMRVRKSKPDKDRPGLWWRGWWREYPDGSGSGVQHWKWLGSVSMMSREEAQAYLQTLIGSANTSPTKNDLPLSTRQLGRIVENVAVRAGLKGVHPHSLRHAFATHLLAHGADLRGIQELLGHTCVSTTMVYTHVAINQLKDTHKKFHPRG
jgi:site-specific recombinase XerD